jgi:alkylation response protein AidB-like acyl-CoA dehydrogenase
MKFAVEVMRPVGVEIDTMTSPAEAVAPGSKFWAVLGQLRDLGFHRASFGADLGGMREEMGPEAASLILEALGQGDAGLAASFTAAALPFQAAACGHDPGLLDLTRAYLGDAGNGLIGCFADLQRGPLGDVERTGDEFVIKKYRTRLTPNGSIATHALIEIPSPSGPAKAKAGIAIIPLDLPGIVRGRPAASIGRRALNLADVFLEEVRISPRHIVTTDPDLTAEIGRTLRAASNIESGLVSIGLSRAAFGEALVYAEERVQGGEPILRHDNVRLKLFRMFGLIESGRAFGRDLAPGVWAPADRVAAGRAAAFRAASSETALKVASEAVQVFGGNGLAREYPVEKMLRDAGSILAETGSAEELELFGAAELF